MTLFAGLSAFPITPATPDGQIIADDLARLLLRLKAAQVDSVGLLGSTGTYAYLDRSARRDAVTIAAETLAGDVPLIVSVGALRTDAAVALAQDAAKAGADGLLMAPVSYTPLTQEEAYQHYLAVAGATDLPLSIYNNPSTTHFNFSTDLLVRLAAIPTITAVKMPFPAQGTVADDFAAVKAHLPADFAIGYSGDWGCADALLAGAQTWYSVVGGILPEPALRLTQAAIAQDAALTAERNAAFAPLWALFRAHGGVRVVYAIAHLLGLTTAQPPRPILPMPDIAQADLRHALTVLGVTV
ncbi:dihydrodipicolinate synthase family protein [Yoonia vestfoldensis]|uniref:dihydrodipicolinate synthase family protein n=1 Tax=Yoonia vestfoldensis TaxID=245188 RepID=UPI00036F5485|nr:dihydrodipicolinate synthase family protein [Yoonia vestfoldensis]